MFSPYFGLLFEIHSYKDLLNLPKKNQKTPEITKIFSTKFSKKKLYPNLFYKSHLKFDENRDFETVAVFGEKGHVFLNFPNFNSKI